MCNNRDPDRSGFQFQTPILSVLCAMFQVYLSFVVNLQNVFLEWLPDFSLKLLLLFRWLQLLLVYISRSTFVVSLYINSWILVSCLLPFARYLLLLLLFRSKRFGGKGHRQWYWHIQWTLRLGALKPACKQMRNGIIIIIIIVIINSKYQLLYAEIYLYLVIKLDYETYFMASSTFHMR